MKGTSQQCNLTPLSKSYQYKEMVNDLKTRYGFKNLGEGGFGTVLGNNICAIKVIKDSQRCTELVKEKSIYQIIEANRNLLNGLKGKIPQFIIFEELHSFNMERIYPPGSSYGDIYEDEDYGQGYVLGKNSQGYIFNNLESGKTVIKDPSKVYLVDRPGKLVHFFVNHYDPNLKEKLDQDQGYILGKNELEKSFKYLDQLVMEIGQLISFIIFVCGVAPFDVEIVIGSKSETDRVITPFLYDFNESEIIPVYNHPDVRHTVIARSLYNKNGKYYFPNNKNIYYDWFRRGFKKFDQNGEADKILEKYNEMFE